MFWPFKQQRRNIAHIEQCQDPKGKEWKCQQHADNVKIIVALNCIGNKLVTNEDREERRDAKKARREILTIGLIFAAFLASAVADCIFYKQLDETRAEQRPWISAAITGPSSTLKREGDSLTLTVKYHLKNVGKVPASRVFFYATLVQLNNAADIKDIVIAACTNIIDRLKTDINGAGITIFPDGLADSDFGITDAIFADFFPGKDGLVSILVPVCTPYKIPDGTQTFHYTAAAYILVVPSPEGLKGIDLNHLPADGIAPEIHPMAQGNLPPT